MCRRRRNDARRQFPAAQIQGERAPIASGVGVVRCRSTRLGRCLPTWLPAQAGGAASYLAEVSRDDFARRYGAFLGFLQRTGRLDRAARLARPLTASNSGAETSTHTMRALTNGTVTNRRGAVMATP